MEIDTKQKRAIFIQNSTNIREVFSFARPQEVVTAISTYASSMYGSNLWDLYRVRANQAFNTWNTALKLAWVCPRETHTWIVDNLLCCGLPSLSTVCRLLSKAAHLCQQ